MSTQLFWKKKVVFCGIEATYGVDPALTGALNGIEVRNMSLTPVKLKKVEQNIEQAYLGQLRELVVGQEVQLKFDIAIAGSGAAGTKPAWGTLMRMCKRAETVLAAALAGNAAAGSINSITLAATASAVDDTYRNMVVRATAGTGIGQTAIIKGYAGATKVATFYENVAAAFDATTVYSIDAQTVYSPVDSGDDSGTFYAFLDRLKFIILGARGNVVRTLDPLKVPVFSFTFTGLWGGYSDQASMPVGTNFTAWKIPLAVNSVNTSGFSIHGFTANLYSYTVDDGNQVVHRDDMIGVEDVTITNRKATGTVVIQAPLKGEHDFYADALGTNNNNEPVEGSLMLTHGTVAGNIVRFYEPAVTVSDPTPSDKNGTIALSMALRINPTGSGSNDSIIICQ